MIFKDLKIVGYWNSKWLETNVHSKNSAEIARRQICTIPCLLMSESIIYVSHAMHET